VELEPGVEGLVHVSEMSWTKKNVHPGKIVSTSQEVEVMVLDVDMTKRRISLGLKQCLDNPWDSFAAKYTAGAELEGEVKNITEFGLFVGLPGDIDGMVHLSDLSWDEAGEAARAATGYEAALATATLDEGKRKVARERLSSLELELGKILVQRPLGAFVTVDHVQRAPVPTTFYLLPGSYELQVDYQGQTNTSPLEVLAGREHAVELEEAEPQASAPSAPPEATKPVPLPPPPLDAGISQKTWGWVSVGAGVALGGAAVVLGLRALAARDRFADSRNTDPDARSEAASLRLATNVLWGGATAAGVTGLVLVLTAPTVEF